MKMKKNKNQNLISLTHFNQALLILGSISLAHSFANATLTPTFMRGEKNIYHQSPSGIQEVCVIPAKYPNAKYKAKDLKKEIELCNTSFYNLTEQEKAEGKTTAAICAKTNSTNPALNIYELADGQTKQSVEKNSCKEGDKLAKYKNSTSCSYTPSIVGYYHVSRILGGIGNVPVSVIRSMDIKTHKSYAEQGLKNTKSGDLINQTWSGLNNILNAGLNSSKKDLVLSDDGKQSYGAMIVNPKKEEFYRSLFTPGPDRAVAFREKNEFFKLLRTEKPLDQMFSNKWEASSVQNMIAMRDITEFIILDHILDQEDRFGNIAKTIDTVYMAKDKAIDTQFQFETTSKVKNFEADKAAGLVDLTKAPLKINAMILKDNDCGVSRKNVVKQAELLKYIRHIEPKTYQKLLKFQQSVTQNKSFFTSNLLFTTTDYNEMVANINDAVKILQTNCKAGKLNMDLDIEHYFEKGKISSGSCDLEK